MPTLLECLARLTSAAISDDSRNFQTSYCMDPTIHRMVYWGSVAWARLAPYKCTNTLV